MKIRMKVGIAGVSWSAKPGDVIDIESKEAKRLCESGMAEPVAEKRSAKAEKR